MELPRMVDVANDSRRLGIALEINYDFRESFDPRSHGGESRWLFDRTL
jgi:hypothetical protein